ncbi:MAG: hypothetical protein ATN36_07265 [Epulopiscium sp. Nele67-Bin005]|nr:MAG: hypothetical protein ATN36_07265 [Epulopiscium sp. Nele67-Bin005]
MKKQLSVILGALLSFSVQVSAYQCPVNNVYHVLVNHENSIEPDFVAGEVVMPDVLFATKGDIQKNYMEKTAAKALEDMFNDALEEGVHLIAISGYRDYERQEVLYEQAVASYGIEQKGSAKAGQSEHQTGLAMDIGYLSQSFGDTREGIWLAERCHEYGFTIRYQQGKEHITRYIYEPWHVRYVGVELATRLFEEDKVLEELEYCCPPLQNQAMRVYCDGKYQYKPQVLIFNDVEYLSVREISGLLGIDLSYKNGQIIAQYNNKTIMFNTKESDFFNNTLINIDGYTYVPVNEFLSNFQVNSQFINNALHIFV